MTLKTPAEFKALTDKAHAFGMAAAGATVPTPMIVQQHASMANDASPVVKEWVVPDGACGFAWITIRPATSRFARWMKKAGLASPAYGGGVQVWVSYFNQSVARKEAYAEAYAEVLRDAGVTAYAGSRLD